MTGDITIENDSLVFKLHGIDKVLTFKSSFKVPLIHVKSVSTAPADWNTFKMLKLVGARIPGVIEEGRFYSKEGMLFYEMKDPNKCITVELTDETYKKVVFEVENKEIVADQIRNAIKAKLQ